MTSSPNTRRNTASNPNTPAATLTALAGDTDAGVRYRVAVNANTPTKAIYTLSTDTNSYVARAPGPR